MLRWVVIAWPSPSPKLTSFEIKYGKELPRSVAVYPTILAPGIAGPHIDFPRIDLHQNRVHLTLSRCCGWRGDLAVRSGCGDWIRSDCRSRNHRQPKAQDRASDHAEHANVRSEPRAPLLRASDSAALLAANGLLRIPSFTLELLLQLQVFFPSHFPDLIVGKRILLNLCI